MARLHPELLEALIVIGLMVNQLESERLALDKMKDRATSRKNAVAIRELDSVQIPFENGRQLYYHRKWLQEYTTGKSTLSKAFVLDWSRTWLKVFVEASQANYFVLAPALATPIYFFVGRNDMQTNAGLAHQYYLAVDAPVKRFFWFDKGGHSIPANEPGRMQDLIIDEVLSATK
jgi:pimeloyl-ACP methyl ester carboxylesterase